MTFILYLLAICGIFSICHALYKRLMHKHIENHAVIAEIKGGDTNAEGLIRCLMREHPKSEILIVNRSDNRETRQILKKLCQDYACVHTASNVNDAVLKIQTGIYD